jgi:adenine-specific DNA-methyltransferase
VPLDLTPDDIQQIKDLLDRGEHLPDRYRASLFADASATELIWPGKTTRIETAVLPFQSIEHVDEPRQEASAIPSLFDMDAGTGRQVGGWTNKLVWGDNRLILSSLANGPLRQQIEDAGGLQLVYIDPPFDVGADFSVTLDIGGEEFTKKPSVIEQIAYRDTWGRGRDSYVQMIYERLHLIRSLLSPDGAIFVHVDWRVNSLVRLLLDEVFGSQCFRNEIVWRRAPNLGRQAASAQLGRVIDTIYAYTRSPGADFRGQPPMRSSEVEYTKDGVPTGAKFDADVGLYFTTAPRGDYTDESIARLKSEGRVYESSTGTVYIKYFLKTDGKGRWFKEQRVDTLWDDYDVRPLRHRPKAEDWGYDTQKPEGLLERILEMASREGDLVADFFVGSGTTSAVAERMGRKWIAADLGRFAIHTTRKRLISVQRGLRDVQKEYRAFEVLNLGSYERQHFVGVDVNLSVEDQERQSRAREEAYLSLILRAYAGERATGSPPFHGVKGNAAVLVGPIDAPVTERQVRDAIDAAVDARITRVDVLGFEFEMGLKPLLQDEAKERGVNLALRYIPNDVFDSRAVKSGDVKFHDVAYVEFDPSTSGGEVTVSLTDFAVFYRQEDAEAAAAGLRNRASRVVVDEGQVVKISKDRDGIITREVLTSQWTDWIDYWAVDFDYGSQPEVIRVLEDGVEKQVQTGRFIFENRWQSFRTKQDRDLELVSAPHEYPEPGTYKVAVKVIDIFGNDTTRVVPVRVRG